MQQHSYATLSDQGRHLLLSKLPPALRELLDSKSSLTARTTCHDGKPASLWLMDQGIDPAKVAYLPPCNCVKAGHIELPHKFQEGSHAFLTCLGGQFSYRQVSGSEATRLSGPGKDVLVPAETAAVFLMGALITDAYVDLTAQEVKDRWMGLVPLAVSPSDTFSCWTSTITGFELLAVFGPGPRSHPDDQTLIEEMCVRNGPFCAIDMFTQRVTSAIEQREVGANKGVINKIGQRDQNLTPGDMRRLTLQPMA